MSTNHPVYRMPNRLVLYIGALVALALLAGCQSLQDIAGMAPKPSARVVGASIRGLTMQNAVLMFDLEVTNPYSAALPLLDLSYALNSGGRKILEGSIDPSGSIPARGKQVIQLPATIGFSPLMALLKDVKPGSVVPYTADFKLGVDAPVLGRLDVPMSKSGDLPIPAVPQIEMSSFEIDKLGLDQTRGTVKLRVKNTNQFPLALKRMGMSFSLGGTEVGSTRLSDAANLKPGEAATLSVPLAFSPRTVGASLFNFLRGKQIAYQVSGSIEAGSPFGPVTIPYSKVGNTAVVKP